MEPAAFWSDVLAELGVSPAEGAIAELTRIDTEAWTTIRPDAVSLLSSLSAQGVRLGILSNATREMAQAVRRTPWARYITDWFFSAELRLAKPDRAIYHEVTNALGYPPQSIVFVDDRPGNVEAARGRLERPHMDLGRGHQHAHERSGSPVRQVTQGAPRRARHTHSRRDVHGCAESISAHRRCTIAMVCMRTARTAGFS